MTTRQAATISEVRQRFRELLRAGTSTHLDAALSGPDLDATLADGARAGEAARPGTLGSGSTPAWSGIERADGRPNS